MATEVELLGTMCDANGRAIAFGVQGDEVHITVSHGLSVIRLAPQQQDEFTRWYQRAEERAELNASAGQAT